MFANSFPEIVILRTLTESHVITLREQLIIRDYYTTFSISALVLTRDSHIKPDSEAGGLIWVEG